MYHPRLKGNHYEIGKHYGELLYKTGEDLSSVIGLTKEQKSFGEICLPIYESNLKEIMDEVKGLADGLHQKYENIAYWLFNIYCNEEEHGCSVFAVKTNDSVYFARNMDMYPEYKKQVKAFYIE